MALANLAQKSFDLFCLYEQKLNGTVLQEK